MKEDNANEIILYQPNDTLTLDVIISVGYRVLTIRGIQFRQWANKVLKDYLLRGYSVNQRLMALEDRINRHLSDHDRHLFELDETGFCM